MNKKMLPAVERVESRLHPLKQLIVFGLVIWALSAVLLLFSQNDSIKELFKWVNFASLVWTVACIHRRLGIIEGLDLGSDILQIISDQLKEDETLAEKIMKEKDE